MRFFAQKMNQGEKYIKFSRNELFLKYAQEIFMKDSKELQNLDMAADSGSVWFTTLYDQSLGYLIVEPNKIPTTKQEALLSLTALEIYSSNGSKPLLKVEDFSGYFDKILKLLNS